MHVRRTTTNPLPVLLLDPDTGRANQLATQLVSKGFTIRIENTGAGAQSAIKEGYFATLIVMADLDDRASLEWLEDLRRTASRSWMIVVSPLCDTRTRNLIYLHGGDACVTAPISIDDLTATDRISVALPVAILGIEVAPTLAISGPRQLCSLSSLFMAHSDVSHRIIDMSGLDSSRF